VERARIDGEVGGEGEWIGAIDEVVREPVHELAKVRARGGFADLRPQQARDPRARLGSIEREVGEQRGAPPIDPARAGGTEKAGRTDDLESPRRYSSRHREAATLAEREARGSRVIPPG
jgi:hypothetical protein